MATTHNKRLASIEAKVPQIPPVETMLCEQPWFLDFLASHNLDIDQLRQKGSVIAALPLHVLHEMRAALEVRNEA